MSWLKKGPILGLAGFAVLMWAFFFFLFDPLLKAALIAGGQAAAGAKVEIGDVSTRFAKGELEIETIAVANRSEPMENMIELSRAAFKADVSALLRGKGVVREAALEGMRFGTKRKSSGALRDQPPPSKLSQAISRQIAPAKSAAIGVKSNASAEVDAAKLQGVKKFDEAKAKTKEIEERWKGKGEEIKAIEKEAREIADSLKNIGGGDPLKKVQAAADAQKRIKALTARVEAQKAEAQKDVAEAQALLREAEELRKKDLNGLLAAAGLPTLDSKDLARRLLGAQTAAKLETALRYMRMAKERAAARKSATPAPPSRRAGVDIEFPREHAYPQWLVEGAKITGRLDGVMGGSLDLKGVLSGLTSNPKLYGKPATLTLAGKSAAGPSLTLDGRLDQQKDPTGISADFTGAGFSLAGTPLGDGEVGGTLTAGQAKVRGRIASVGDDWTGTIDVETSGVSIEPKVELEGTAKRLVSDALKSVSSFNVRIGISGKEDDLKLAFSSDIGDVVAGAMKKAVSAELEVQKKELEKKLAAAYGGKAEEARGQVDGLAKKLLGPLDAQKAALDKQLKEAAGKALGGVKLDKLFGR